MHRGRPVESSLEGVRGVTEQAPKKASLHLVGPFYLFSAGRCLVTGGVRVLTRDSLVVG